MRAGRIISSGRIVGLISVVFLLLALVPIASAARVARVIDGDTIVLAGGEKVRYIGVDTPETVHPQKPVEFMGKEASAFNKALVEGKDIRLEYDVGRKDRYGRTLAYVYLDTLFVNAELVRQGYAQVSTYPPNVKYVDLFVALQREARDAGRGLWSEDAAAAGQGAPPITVQSPPSTTAVDTTTYYVTPSGKKYHRAGCRFLHGDGTAIAKADAIARGLGPFSACIGGVPGSLRPSPTPSATPGRCQAITKSGTQCKRKAEPGSKYCWQHGGR